ncbi:hypothetical protein HDV06_006499 [Boothiomyces sp. JEL0866]|nr:hypothetical protein HDV06_006499 [Boothiomyces sp. JEL0866]
MSGARYGRYSHSILGTILMIMVGFQATAGFTTRFGRNYEISDRYIPYIKRFHHFLGYTLLVFAVIQSGLGLNILYPVVEPRDYTGWILYGMLLILWSLLFVLAEGVSRKKNYSIEDIKTKSKVTSIEPILTKMKVQSKNLERLNWETLDKRILEGGGQIILQNVIGTDITNDYFLEAGYDAEDFIPKPLAPDRTLMKRLSQHKRSPKISSARFEEERIAYQSSITREDWHLIKRARRTHIHSKMAIKKLASLVVGEIESSISTSQSTIELTNLDIYEYRRYAITELQYLSNPDSTKPIIRIKFCNLYPCSDRARNDAFLPGQCVELQVQINGQRYSRYYSPVSGNMNAFEIIFKVQAQGVVTPYLMKQGPGDRQFKIRGPLGDPLIKDPFSCYFQYGYPETVCFFAGGSGITPFLQLVSHFFLSTGYAIQEYHAVLSDELDIAVGDQIQTVAHYYDGWSYGFNISTGERGAFPLACIQPLAPVRLILINTFNANADLIGTLLIEAVRLGYPECVDTFNFSSSTLNIGNVSPIVNSLPPNISIIICGPNAYNSYVADMLFDYYATASVVHNVQNGLLDTAAFKEKTYQFNTILYDSSEYLYKIFWSVNDTTLDAMISLTSTNGDALDFSWIALGFGTAMFNGEMVVCHNLNNGTQIIEEHYGQMYYLAPLLNQGVTAVSGTVGNVSVSQQNCGFTRPLIPNDQNHAQLSSKSKVTMLWAFNPSPGLNYLNQLFSYHGQNYRGSFSVLYSTGFFETIPLNNFQIKQIHGFGMMSIWFVILPLGAFVARHFKSFSGWYFVKISLQSFSTIITVVLIVVAQLSGAAFGSTFHSILGTIIAAFVGVQGLAGVITRFGLQFEKLTDYVPNTKMIHRYLGYTLLTAAIVQAGMGINMLYPVVEPRTVVPWVLYGLLVAIWLIAFGVTEFAYRRANIRKESGYSRVPSTNIDPILKNEKVQKQSLTKFSWKTLDQEILSGKLYVVSNGKYVHDISKWILSHPGGQIILQNVAGTDITNDYFHEAGYDAEEFIAKPKAPKRDHSEFTSDVTNATRRSRIVDKHNSNFLAELNAHQISFYHEEDWTMIKRARRTHIHSRLALQKLADLVVGEIDSSPQGSQITIDPSENLVGRPFDSHEYRRYAITALEVLSKPQSTKPIIKIRFCLLYPFDVRDNLPLTFFPGQCIEIQVRINGQRYSRYYTPVSGNMNAFEIVFKVQTEGVVTPYLMRQEPGDKQFKIRGPFGVPLIPDPFSGYHEFGYPQNICFFAGGSGITPFLQLISHFFLSTGYILPVIQDYRAQLSDEMSLRYGDQVQTTEHFMDGWAHGYNLTTGEKGSFPLSCLEPLAPIKLVLFNSSNSPADLIGMHIIDAVKLAYPDSIEIYSFTSASLKIQNIAPVLDPKSQNMKLIVCGPVGFNSAVVDLLADYKGSWTHDMRVLASDTF